MIFLFKYLPKLVIFADTSIIKRTKVGRSRQLFNGPHGGFFKFAAISTTVFILIMILRPGTNLIRWVRSSIEISRQEKQIEMYNKEIGRMEQRIKMLESDRDTLEKFAREQFHFAEPGDDVYITE